MCCRRKIAAAGYDSAFDEPPMSARRRRRAFTLVELLVVIAIVALLLSILSPSVGKIRLIALRFECGSRLSQLIKCYMAYSTENDEKLVGSTTYYDEDWVRRPGKNPTEGERIDAIKEGKLWPYVRNLELYSCTTPSGIEADYIRHYSISGNMNGEGSRWTKLTQIPGRTLLMIEDYDPRGYNVNSWFIQRNGWYWWNDYVPGNHMHGDNVGFSDGSVEYWEWKDPNTLLIYSPWHGFGLPDDGNVDLDRLGRVFKDKKFYP